MSEVMTQCDPLAHARAKVDAAWDFWLVAKQRHERAGEDLLKSLKDYLESNEIRMKRFDAWEKLLEELKTLEGPR